MPYSKRQRIQFRGNQKTGEVVLGSWFPELCEQERSSKICEEPHTTRLELSNTPALHEAEKAVHQLKNNKTAGADSIPTEALKCGGKQLLLQLHALVCLIWKEESILVELQEVTVVSIFKKENKSNC
eukprot:g47043.t1